MIASLTDEQRKLHDRMCDEAMYYGTCTLPADRPRAEKAISRMYELKGRKIPSFIWVDGPASGLILLEILKSRLSIGSSLELSLASSLESSLVSSLWSSLESSLESSLVSSLVSSLELSLRSSLVSSLVSSLWSSLRSSLESSLVSSLESSLWSSIGSSLESSLWPSFWPLLRSSLESSLESSLVSSLESSLWSLLWSSLESSLRSSIGSSLRSSLESSLKSAFWGQHSLAWITFYQFCGTLGKIYKPDYQEKLDLWLDIGQSCNWWLPYENVVICCERPTICKINKNRVLHCDDGPSMMFRDGYQIHSLNGVVVPEWLVLTKAEDIDPKKFLKIENVEVRREFVRKVGIERVWHKNAIVIHRMNDYELGEIEIAPNVNGKFLKMLNPSIGTWHVEGVSNECNTVEQALRFRQPAAMKALPVSEDGDNWYQQGDVCIWPKGAKSIKPFPSVLT